MDQPFVISIIGLSSSGKTAQGRRLYECLNRLPGCASLELIDGDSVREFLKGKIGYAAKDRKLSAAVQTQLAHMLYKHGISSIVCNISPFEESRQFGRNKIPGLVEIHLDCPLQTCMQRDRELQKNVYEPVLAGRTSDVNIVGVDIEFETPDDADLVLRTELQSEIESFYKIIKFLEAKWGISLAPNSLRSTGT